MSGDHNLCLSAAQTIVDRFGGFADKVRADDKWITPLPEGIDPAKIGPLFCVGLTVFNPLVQFDVKSTDRRETTRKLRVGVIRVGGLGLALKSLQAWGCDVTAFSTNPAKETEIREMGASHFVNSRDDAAIAAVANSFDFILSTVAVTNLLLIT